MRSRVAALFGVPGGRPSLGGGVGFMVLPVRNLALQGREG